MPNHIGFYVDSSEFKDGIDFNKIGLGNPGIGGSWYTTLLLALKIAETSRVHVSLFLTKHIILSEKIKLNLCNDIFHAVSLASENEIDLFILNQFSVSENLVKFIDEGNMKCAVWTHIYIDYITANIISKSKNIKVNIFVGKQQYDYYIDHPVIKKSIVIFNGVSINQKYRQHNDGLTVTYLGALYYSKYFHVLAKVWKEVVKKVPNAKLNVIGSGNIYNKNTRLGSMGVASEEYENLFLPYLKNEDGSLMESVSFLGGMGYEKNEILIKTSVGVVNPTGISECLPMSVLEFLSFGVPVVTKNAWAYPDVIVHNKTGILYLSEMMLANKIVKLLKDHDLNNNLGKNARTFTISKFDIENIVWKWIDLIHNLNTEEVFEKPKASAPYFNQLKLFRIFNRQLIIKVGLKIPPVIEIERRIKDRIKYSNLSIMKYLMGYYEKRKK